MRIVTLSVLLATSLVACAEDPPAKDPSSTKDSSSDKGSGGGDKAASGDKTAAASGGGKTELTCKGKPDIGKNASSFSITSINTGSKMGVDKGKVTIVDFWATWCEPCKKSFPKYQDLYVKYKSSGLEIVAVSVDDEKKDIPDFIKTYGAKFPVGWDEGHKIAECYHPPNMPSAYVIDKTGVIKFVHNGYHDGEEKELEKEVKGLL